MTIKIYHFQNFCFDTFERKLSLNGLGLKISPKALGILQLLVEKGGQIVTKEEIISELWPDTFIEEGNIPVHISAIRKKLGENEQNQFIETVPGLGYRFICRVKEEMVSDINFSSANTISRIEPINRESVAILPFKNIDDNREIDYLVDGFSETLINNLSANQNLRVISRETVFGFQGSGLPALEIGRRLSVRKILTGRIKIIGDNLSIGTELIQVQDDSQLWGKNINRPFSEILEIQNDIISDVQSFLVSRPEDQGRTFRANPHGNQESYRAYLKAKHFLSVCSPESTRKAIEYFENALQKYPFNSFAYAGLIRSYINLYSYGGIKFDESRDRVATITSNISSLNISTGETEAALGSIELKLNWNFAKAEEHFKRAVELKPDSVELIYHYAELLVLVGRFSEALKLMIRAEQIEAISIYILRRKAALSFLMGQVENSVSYARELVELYPQIWVGNLILGVGLALQKKRDEAVKVLQITNNIENNLEALAMIGFAEALAGNTAEALDRLKELELISKNKSFPPIYFAYIYRGLGDYEKVFEMLELAFLRRDIDLISLKVDPRWDALRKDPRYFALLKKIGFPA